MTPTDDDYELLDSGDGRKLERFGRIVLARPCAQAVWKPSLPEEAWARADAAFDRADGNRWHNRGALPAEWTVRAAGIAFRLSGTDFGHLGIFPEQREQWAWIRETVARARATRRDPVQVLNLFAYSGGSTLAAALGGAAVCHLDASKGMVQWARDNARLNGLEDRPIRWIADDAHTFLCREARRGRRYDAVILDPPTFGRGQGNELYKIEKDLPETLRLCRELLTPDPLFVLLSAHTPGYSPVVLRNVLGQAVRGLGGALACGELLLTGAEGVPPAPCGAFARWLRDSPAARDA
jgi:23S rRNA (cytosine1962-C5)-methyltransferase